MTDRATVIYIPHGGGPMPLLDEAGHAGMNGFLRGVARDLPVPGAIVVISAHWEASPIAITASASPALLFDYYGFPPQTYDYRYPAPGHPDLARRIHHLLADAGIEASLDSERGLDHGVFVPLLLMYPAAEIPCLQLSLSASLDAGEHLRIGAALSSLMAEDLLVLGSGFSFHNLQARRSKRDDAPDADNLAFEQWLYETCTDQAIEESVRAQRLSAWETAAGARYCHPREEHLLPLHVCYGLAGRAAQRVFYDRVSGFKTSAYRWR